MPLELLVEDRLHPRGGEPTLDHAKILEQERRVSLAGRGERFLDAEVELHSARAEPAAAPGGDVRRLGDLIEAEDLAVEADRLGLPAGWHGQLDMVEPEEPHGASLTTRPSR